MANILSINYTAIESVVSGIRSKIKSSSIEADYDKLIDDFEKSEGEEARALRALLQEEKALAKQMGETLGQFANSIQFAVNEFKGMDTKSAVELSSGSRRRRRTGTPKRLPPRKK